MSIFKPENFKNIPYEILVEQYWKLRRISSKWLFKAMELEALAGQAQGKKELKLKFLSNRFSKYSDKILLEAIDLEYYFSQKIKPKKEFPFML